MGKKILITGATDGIGLETAKKLKSLGHEVIVHGRSSEKLQKVVDELGVTAFKADFSKLTEVRNMADSILEKYDSIDVLINNAGVFKTSSPRTEDGHDVRYVVNTFAPYLLTKKLLSILKGSRVINLSSAAQSSVDFDAMIGKVEMSDFEAYAQSKLAITMWSRYLANEHKDITVIAVNPGSLLSTKMVKEGFNTSGNDITIGVNILTSLSLEGTHTSHSGDYYDNDNQRYAPPQADGLDDTKTKKIVELLEDLIK
ncbi:SDR family NAD(P)-dependent oxidoreductase [Halobacteriovorax sp. HLS]|uniref:SDR family NAD(P)-dependent oxidoreductase n=1 Tax=Halobacteriovorax sp. HLS TaxID=2234000 RepID=UPI000FD7B2ED|nr:SDR family NAD(P)-dependent oxidoreductase [Halobacteriovorax sp. HLS]